MAGHMPLLDQQLVAAAGTAATHAAATAPEVPAAPITNEDGGAVGAAAAPAAAELDVPMPASLARALALGRGRRQPSPSGRPADERRSALDRSRSAILAADGVDASAISSLRDDTLARELSQIVGKEAVLEERVENMRRDLEGRFEVRERRLAEEHGEALAARSAALSLSSEEAVATMRGQLQEQLEQAAATVQHRAAEQLEQGRAQMQAALADADGQRMQAALLVESRACEEADAERRRALQAAHDGASAHLAQKRAELQAAAEQAAEAIAQAAARSAAAHAAERQAEERGRALTAAMDAERVAAASETSRLKLQLRQAEAKAQQLADQLEVQRATAARAAILEAQLVVLQSRVKEAEARAAERHAENARWAEDAARGIEAMEADHSQTAEGLMVRIDLLEQEVESWKSMVEGYYHNEQQAEPAAAAFLGDAADAEAGGATAPAAFDLSTPAPAAAADEIAPPLPRATGYL